MKKVIRLTESELTNLISRIITETEMSGQVNTPTDNVDFGPEGEMEEGIWSWLGRSVGAKGDMADQIDRRLKLYRRFNAGKGVDVDPLSQEEKESIKNDILKQAHEDGYSGEAVYKMDPDKGTYELIYRSGWDAESRSPNTTSIAR